MIENLAIQLHALQKECEADLEGTLKKLKKMGFSGVEFSGYFGRTPEEIVDLLELCGLELTACHVQIEWLLDDFDEVVDFHKRLGTDKLVIYFGDIHGSESLSLLIDNLNSLNCRLRQHRIELYYHNHEQEFKNYGTSSIALYEILDRTDLLLELDGFWAEQAGADIAEIMENYSDRVSLVHLKDGENHVPCAIGKGKANCKEFYDLAIEYDVEWIIVELAELSTGTMEAVEQSVEFIKNNF